MMQKNSLAGRLMRFYAENPHEELTFADIATKFGCTQRNALTTVQRLKAKGLVESVHVVRAPLKERLK